MIMVVARIKWAQWPKLMTSGGRVHQIDPTIQHTLRPTGGLRGRGMFGSAQHQLLLGVLWWAIHHGVGIPKRRGCLDPEEVSAVKKHPGCLKLGV